MIKRRSCCSTVMRRISATRAVPSTSLWGRDPKEPSSSLIGNWGMGPDTEEDSASSGSPGMGREKICCQRGVDQRG
jgi:hypothetical protein